MDVSVREGSYRWGFPLSVGWGQGGEMTPRGKGWRGRDGE